MRAHDDIEAMPVPNKPEFPTRAVEEPDAGDVEALALVLHRAFHDHWNPSKPLDLYADSPLWRAQAEAIAKRDAARDAATAARALTDMADAMDRVGWAVVRSSALRDRAARIARGEG